MDYVCACGGCRKTIRNQRGQIVTKCRDCRNGKCDRAHLFPSYLYDGGSDEKEKETTKLSNGDEGPLDTNQ